MGFQKDQSFTGTTYRPGTQQPIAPPHGVPPPLPPRAASALLRPVLPDPPPYERTASEYKSQPLTHSWSGQDPRQRSTESLVPSGEGRAGRRTLLLIFIHGFLGNETSFQSFPAHIHNLVTTRLADTHTVHTKIYPRYKSRKAVDYARDDFSNWLYPNETPETDVILLGHSMGGILSAEVALLAPYSAADRRTYRHRILGTINFDTPFLGMHPGVIVSGIGSLFKAKPASPTLKPVDGTEAVIALMPMPQQLATPNGTFAGSGLLPTPGREDSPSSGYFPDQTAESLRSPVSSLSPLATPINDPNFDPPFPNDVRLPVRKGWDSTLHFIMKHSDGLTKATKSYVTSHLEFGGALADYRGLKARYERLRALEDVDESRPESMQEYRPPRRIRFVNYYTASTGRAASPTAKVKAHPEQQQLDGTTAGLEDCLQRATLSAASDASTRSASRSPRISIEDPAGAHVEADADEDADPAEEEPHALQTHSMAHLAPDPTTDDEAPPHDDDDDEDNNNSTHEPPPPPSTTSALPAPSEPSSPPSPSSPTLPPLPPVPSPPSHFDPTPYPSKDTLKLAQRAHAHLVKTHQRAVRDRDRAIAARRHLLAKRDKAALQAARADEKKRRKDDAARLKTHNAHEDEQERPPQPALPQQQQQQPPPRDRKFCMLPPRGKGQERDACWPRVFMRGVDEVGAHCGLFVAGKVHYEGLVGDVGGRVVRWVRERDGGGGGD